MADEPELSKKSKTEWQFPSWKKIAEFAANAMHLERSVER
jgi:hypothetical protein